MKDGHEHIPGPYDGIGLVRPPRVRHGRLLNARKKGTHTKKKWIALVEEFERRCVRCGRDDMPVERDHIVPLVLKESSDSIRNIQPLCAPCNSSKDKRGNDIFNWKAFRRKNGFEVNVPPRPSSRGGF